MSRFVITLLEENVDRPATIDDWLAELAPDRTERPDRATSFSPSATLREIRDELDR